MKDLKINISGIEITLGITGYKKAQNKSDEFNNWCKCDLMVRSHNNGEYWINYRTLNKEILLSCEVDSLIKTFTKLLDGEDLEHEFVSLIEPDIQFELSPRREIKISSGIKILEPSMDFIINFWDNGVLTGNYLSVSFNKDEILELLNYLKRVKIEAKADK